MSAALKPSQSFERSDEMLIRRARSGGWVIHHVADGATFSDAVEALPIGATADGQGLMEWLGEQLGFGWAPPAPSSATVTVALAARVDADVLIARDQYAALAAALKPFIAVHDHPQVSGGEAGDMFVLDVGADAGAGLTVDDFRNLITAAGDVGLVNRPAPVEPFHADDEVPF